VLNELSAGTTLPLVRKPPNDLTRDVAMNR
jgi:hypothetical protein